MNFQIAKPETYEGQKKKDNTGLGRLCLVLFSAKQNKKRHKEKSRFLMSHLKVLSVWSPSIIHVGVLTVLAQRSLGGAILRPAGEAVNRRHEGNGFSLPIAFHCRRW